MYHRVVARVQLMHSYDIEAETVGRAKQEAISKAMRDYGVQRDCVDVVIKGACCQR